MLIDISGHHRVQECKRKPVDPNTGLCREECEGCKVSVVLCQPIGLMQVVGMEGSVVVSITYRHFVIEEILTSIIVKHRTLKSAKWKEGNGKKVQYFINKWIIQSKTIGRGKS